MSKKPKLEVNEVFVLEEVLPYYGSKVLGVFTTPEAAMDTRSGDWTEVHEKDEHYWTTAPPDGGTINTFWWVTSFPVRTK